MRLLIATTLLLFIVITSESFASDDTVTYDDVYKIGGVTFKNFTTEPFSGDIKLFDKSSEFYGTHKYEKGELIYQEEFFRGGSLNFKRNFKKGELSYEEYFHPNGSLHFKRHFKNGLIRDGDYIHKYPDGTVSRTYSVKNGELFGLGSSFSSDGEISEILELRKDRTFSERWFFKSGNLRRIRIGKLNPDGVYRPNEYPWFMFPYEEMADFTDTVFYPNGKIFSKQLFQNKFLNGYSDQYWTNNEILSHRKFYKNDQILGPNFSDELVFYKFPICLLKSSIGQRCKFISNVERQKFTFENIIGKYNRIKIHDKETFAHFETEGWNYIFDVSIDEENNLLLKFTDDSKLGTYFTSSTYKITFSEEKKNWVINSETVNYIRGSEDDKKIEGKVIKFTPPIPFIECLDISDHGKCLK